MAEFDPNAPATKGDLAELETRIETRIVDRLTETVRDVQTELLKAFYNFADTNNKRIAQNEVNEVALRSRVETLERRVMELEHRLNMPPAA